MDLIGDGIRRCVHVYQPADRIQLLPVFIGARSAAAFLFRGAGFLDGVDGGPTAADGKESCSRDAY